MHVIKQETEWRHLDAMLDGRRLVCDLDGTLVHTKSAVIEAYARAGADEPWRSQTQHWTEWTTPKIHRMKNRIFKRTAKGRCWKLPLYRYAEKNNGLILSSCSKSAFITLAKELDIRLEVLGLGLTKEEKMDVLRQIKGSFFYIDDNLEMCRWVRQTHGFTSVALVEEK